jgi:hypothetical protein
MDEALRAELLAMRDADARTREELHRLGELEGGYHPRMEAVHVANARRLKEIVAAHGWPGHALVGDDGAEAAWRILQHAIGDPPFQRSTLDLLRDAVSRGDAPAWQAAYLEDRICMFEGRLQVYGTQYQVDVDGYTRRWETAEPERLDERRRAVGLEPAAEEASSATPMPLDQVRAYLGEYEAWLKSVGWRS